MSGLVSVSVGSVSKSADLVSQWRAGVDSLDPRACSVPGIQAKPRGPRYEPPPWPSVHAAMLAFLDRWGEQAAALGWSTEALFGVHRLAGAVRVDATGALVTLQPWQVEAIEPGLLRLVRRRAGAETRQTNRGLSNPDESVPIWTFGRA